MQLTRSILHLETLIYGSIDKYMSILMLSDNAVRKVEDGRSDK